MEDSTTEARFIGVDFHRDTTVVTRLRQDGSRCGKTQSYPSTRAGLTEFKDSCTAADHVAVEATYHWALFADVFEELVEADAVFFERDLLCEGHGTDV